MINMMLASLPPLFLAFVLTGTNKSGVGALPASAFGNGNERSANITIAFHDLTTVHEEKADQDEDIHDVLVRIAKASQRNFVAAAPELGLDPSQFRYYPIANAICIDLVPLEVIQELEAREDVFAISRNEKASAHSPPPSQEKNFKMQGFDADSTGAFNGWDGDGDGGPVSSPWEGRLLEHVNQTELRQIVTFTGADKLWEMHQQGQGIVVGISSTGVNFEHEALDGYRGRNADGTYTHDYNWYDAFPNGKREPYDVFNLGTHITGTIAGTKNGVGMAPRAKYISCRSINALREDTPESMLLCLQFFLAPFDVDGNNPNPKKRPDIVMTQTCESCDDSFFPMMQQTIVRMHEAGIFVISPSGGYFLGSSRCAKIRKPPANIDTVMTIGGIEANSTHLVGSASGPGRINGTVNFELLKPNAVTLGRAVLGPVFLNNQSLYFGATGSTVSAAVASGVVALLLRAMSNLLCEFCKKLLLPFWYLRAIVSQSRLLPTMFLVMVR